MVLLPASKGGTSILFCRERDAHREMWDGKMVGTQGAVETYGFDHAFPISEIKKRLPRLLRGRERVVYDLGKDPEFDQLLIGWMNSGSCSETSRPQMACRASAHMRRTSLKLVML